MNENCYQQLVQHSPDAILVECDGSVALVNPAALRLFQAEDALDLLGRSMVSLSAPGCRRDVATSVEQALLGCPSHAVEEKALGIDGSTTDIEATRLMILHDGKPAVYMIARDISLRKRLELQLRHEAIHDALTGLPNRSFLNDCLGSAVVQAKQARCDLAIAFIDLDRFKQVNDVLGHHAGDILLKLIADRLLSCLRKSDTVARIGGDEFVLVLRDCGGEKELAEVLDRLRDTISMPVMLCGQEVVVTSSIGCCLYPAHAGDAEDLLRLSDAAMYRAKKTGGDKVEFYRTETAQPRQLKMNVC